MPLYPPPNKATSWDASGQNTPAQSPWMSRLTEVHGLRNIPYDKLIGWGFGDFIFDTEFNMISDMGKIRRAGFTETKESGASIVAAIHRLIEKNVLPSFA